MNKIAIIYSSTHHENTKKVVFKMKEERDLDLYDVLEVKDVDFSKYDYIGFASGIYFQDFSKSIKKFIENFKFKQNQKVFLIYTCGLNVTDYSSNVKKILKEKKVEAIGTFSCRGYDTFGPFKIIGGIAKKHPNNKDFDKAKEFIKNIIK